MPEALEIRKFESGGEIAAGDPLMRERRDPIRADTFLAEIRRQQA